MSDQNKTPRQYDAGDLHDAYNLAHESHEWLTVLLRQIRAEIKETQTRLEAQGIHEAHFYTLNKLADLTEFMADERMHAMGELSDKYKKEYMGDK